MRYPATFLGAVLLLTACNAPPVSMLGASSGTSEGGTSSGASGAETAGDPCADGIDILGHCYHQTIFESITTVRAAAAADFNGDGAQDVITTCRGTNESYAICLLQLNGTVTKLDLDWTDTGQAHVNAADFNQDGIPDILVSEFDHFAVFTVDNDDFVLHSEFIYDHMLGDPADALMFPALPIDIDQDGAAEVVAGGRFFTGVRLWRHGPAGWAPAGERQPLAGCGDLKSGRVADLDGDGSPELVAIGSHNDCGDGPVLPGSGWNQISIFTGDENGPGIVTMGAFAAELAGARLDLGDFNNDGDVDIVVGDDDDNMMVFAGSGDGTFELLKALIGDAAGGGLHAADFNADGVDEIVAQKDDYSYRILMGLPVPIANDLPESMTYVFLTKDLNGDGRADIVSDVKLDGEYRPVLTLSDL